MQPGTRSVDERAVRYVHGDSVPIAAMTTEVPRLGKLCETRERGAQLFPDCVLPMIQEQGRTRATEEAHMRACLSLLSEEVVAKGAADDDDM